MTALELIISALKLLGVLAEGETPTAGESKDGLQALNGMLKSWKLEKRLATDLATFTGYVLADPMALGDGYERAIRYNLAVELAPEYGKAVSGEVYSIATKSIANIKKNNYTVTVKVAVDPALLPETNWDINA